MPFPDQTPTPFTRGNVVVLNPGQRGVYGLFRENQWVYVGRSTDMRDRLLDHINGDNDCITRENPTHFVDEVTDNDVERERALITEFNPICNRVGT